MAYSALEPGLSNAEFYRRVQADVKRSQAGVISGVCGIVFGILGIFTVGAIFVPVAALFSLISILKSLFASNPRGLVIGLAALLLTLVGFVVSPTAWLEALTILSLLFGQGEVASAWVNISSS